MNTIRVSSSFDPDQARQNVGPDLDSNCLQRLSADDKLATCKALVKGKSTLSTILVDHIMLNDDS